MLIAHLITALSSGGAENQLQQLVLASDRCRFRHVVIVLSEAEPIASELKLAGVEVHLLRMKAGTPSPVGLFRLVRLLRHLRPDVLHCWLYHACLMGLVAGRLAGIRNVIWGLRAAQRKLDVFSALTRIVIRSCARLSRFPQVIVVNSMTSRAVHQQLGYSTTRMRMIPNGVDAERFAPDLLARSAVRAELNLPADALLVGMIARYDALKDHGTFLQAAALVLRRDLGVKFILAGDGITADNAELWQLVQENGLQQVVYLLGPRRDIPRLTAALDIACLSSWSESFPNVVIEAMACGVPCVATDVGDTASIVGDTGRCVPSRDPVALAEGLGTLIAMQEEDRMELGRTARDRILAQFALQKTIITYDDMYGEFGGKHLERLKQGNAQGPL